MALFNVVKSQAYDNRNTVGNLRAGVPFLMAGGCHKDVLYIKLNKLSNGIRISSAHDRAEVMENCLVVNPKIWLYKVSCQRH